MIVDASIRVQESTPDMMISSLKSGWQQLAAVATLNSRVVLQKKDDQDDLQPTGDATELGLYRYFSGVIQMAWGMEIETFRESNPKVRHFCIHMRSYDYFVSFRLGVRNPFQFF